MKKRNRNKFFVIEYDRTCRKIIAFFTLVFQVMTGDCGPDAEDKDIALQEASKYQSKKK